MFEEEKQKFRQSLGLDDNINNSASKKVGNPTKCHPLTKQHNCAVYETILCKLLEYFSFPILSAFNQRLDENLRKVSLPLSFLY